ncbi:2-succinyl-5-enolpyruvyl-6-hydroxy-3-cyclohexene-1-carboxylic-acid synthase [Paucihalobacter sp.]|uniref:2-succinyl-5-enolpyruvyl-6-hydroxy-3- cyclohexene-1-carboxylic-acid synthase n=1 Tax=Paucihalobacter sp. TaxID=2850405 RepID=UPI002FDF6AD2
MSYPKIPLAQTVVELCKLQNIRHIVISPGSRNAPLTIGFTFDEFFQCYSIVDERCAAFFALGIAQQTKTPVVLVCTSGSAMLNYYPAIAEAFYSRIPLVVLSADRPKHLLEIGDGQTIMQSDVYGKHVLFSSNLKLDVKDENYLPEEESIPLLKNLEQRVERFLGIQKDIQEYNEFELQRAISIASQKMGPVHVNIPFDDPLYELVPELTVKLKLLNIEPKLHKLDDFQVKNYAERWLNSERKMVLVGVSDADAIDQDYLNDLAQEDSVVVFTETTSNLHHPQFFPGIDKLISPLSEAELEQLQPDLLITFGGLIVSKRIKSFLRKYKPKEHWHIDPHRAYDTFFCLTAHIPFTPNEFFKSFMPKLTHHKKSDYKNYFLQLRQIRRSKHAEYVQIIPFSDFKAYDKVLNAIPSKAILQVGNSAAVRYTQLFQISKTIDVYCNRGTSGIDGSTSTAVGCAVVNKRQTVFLTGDLSFFYDSNGLWNNYIPKNFRIIVINNQGGGIFRILPGHKNTENFDTFFETKHHLNAKPICDLFGFSYHAANDEKSLDKALVSFFKSASKPKLLEVFTPRLSNDDILLDYFKFIK